MLRSKIKKIINPKRLVAVGGLVVLWVLAMLSPLSAQTVSQGYASDEKLTRGILVSISDTDPTKIVAASTDNEKRLQGVIINPNDAPVTISSDDQKNFVATVGRYPILVSDQNGTISSGDFITVSLLSGIGAKATDKSEVVVGKAIEAFDGKNKVIRTSELTESNGAKKSVNIGMVQVDIGVSSNPLAKPEKANLPEFLKKASEAVAKKPVSAVRVYISLVVLAASMVVAGSVLYSGIRSSMISIGRNPLSKKSIVRSLIQIILTGLTIFICGLFGVYLLLKI